MSKRRHLMQTCYRVLALRCPVCGAASIVQSPFRIRHHCPACRALFMREEGFFVGPVMIDVVAAEVASSALYFLGLLTVGVSDFMILAAVLPMILVFTFGFYHHSWSLWLGFDYLVESLPKYDGP
ncbi:MAG TPA: hypothetical protein VF546_04385 [Pyrinomonadaceae bacterium]|jgi:uncharacterized protein (DUF983 family)